MKNFLLAVLSILSLNSIFAQGPPVPIEDDVNIIALILITISTVSFIIYKKLIKS